VTSVITELPLLRELAELHKELIGVQGGELASYIAPLAAADPDQLAIAVVTVDGHCYSVGDATAPFTIQSVSKPFAYALALDDLGFDAVLERVGVEPTGDAFNSITVDEVSGRPFNPMVNAGAIVTTSLLHGSSGREREQRLFAGMASFAGRELAVDGDIFAAERDTGDRNRAIAYLMRTFEMLREDVEQAVTSYFKQCSLLVDVRDLAIMGATLANHGLNPMTGGRAVDQEHVARVLSVMSSCGMYDYAGEWFYRVGLPAKSGVSGAVIAVLPGVLSIAAFSPRLDARGNSVRAVMACEALARRFRLHVFDARASASPIRLTFDGSMVRSKRRRRPEEVDSLRRNGSSIAVIETQGPLHFGAAEVITREIARRQTGTSHLVLDLSRVTAVDDGALTLLHAAVQGLVERGTVVAATGAMAVALQMSGTVATFDDHDAALEWCEDDLLGGLGFPSLGDSRELADQELLRNFPREMLAIVESQMTLVSFPAGSVIFREGAEADAIYFVVSGRVRIVLDLEDRQHSLTTIGPGGSFGEMATIDGGSRSATVRADEDTVCHVLPLDALARLEADLPGFTETLYRTLAANLARRLRDVTEEIRVLRS
jgi:glutaminase